MGTYETNPKRSPYMFVLNLLKVKHGRVCRLLDLVARDDHVEAHLVPQLPLLFHHLLPLPVTREHQLFHIPPIYVQLRISDMTSFDTFHS